MNASLRFAVPLVRRGDREPDTVQDTNQDLENSIGPLIRGNQLIFNENDSKTNTLNSSRGELRDPSITTTQEQGASLVVLGRPSDPESVFQLESLEAFAAVITSKTGIELQIV